MPESYKGAIIDLSNDFHLAADAEDFVYGLPEAFRDKIVKATYRQSWLLRDLYPVALLPMAKADKLP